MALSLSSNPPAVSYDDARVKLILADSVTTVVTKIGQEMEKEHETEKKIHQKSVP